MKFLARYAFRRATLDDLLLIVSWARSAEELRYVFPRATWPAETLQLIEHLASHEEGFVVCDQDRVVGFANLYNPRAQKTWIGHLIVHPERRRFGVANYLISALKTIAKERYQSQAIATICYENNVAGLAFYQKLGFTPRAGKRAWIIVESRSKRSALSKRYNKTLSSNISHRTSMQKCLNSGKIAA